MSTTRLTLGKYLCGMAASLIIGLAGGWLILAPFALGYQSYGADWTDQTVNDFAVGIPVAVVALISFALFFMSLLGFLRATGVLVSRPKPQPQEALTPVRYQSQVTAPLAMENGWYRWRKMKVLSSQWTAFRKMRATRLST